METLQSDRMAALFSPYKHSRSGDGEKIPIVLAQPAKDGAHPPIGGCDWARTFEFYELKILRCGLGSGTEETAEIYGRIDMFYPNGYWYLFYRTKDEAETVTLPGTIRVKTPPVGIQGKDMTSIMFQLEGIFSEMNNEYRGWECAMKSDEVLGFTIEKEHCALEVSFMSISKAILADVEISLVNEDGVDEEKAIYGEITLWYTKEMKGMRSFVLFEKKEDERVILKGEEPIPLLRSVISVPIGSGLVVDAKLRTLSGEEIVRGIVYCESPHQYGEYVGILGKYGKNQVSVKFNLCSYDDHSLTQEASKRGITFWP